MMQYILTEKEYNDLKDKQKLELRKGEQRLQNLCTKIANEMPVTWGWGGPDPKPWGCMITNVVEGGYEWYCDKCPVQEICPSENKDWSK